MNCKANGTGTWHQYSVESYEGEYLVTVLLDEKKQIIENNVLDIRSGRFLSTKNPCAEGDMAAKILDCVYRLWNFSPPNF
jgi:hypothetical protein